MKRLTVHLVVACLAIGVGIAAANVASPFLRNPAIRWPSNTVSRAVEADGIREAVFRHQIQSYDSGGARIAFFLSCGGDVDPDDEVMGRLKADGLPVSKLTELSLFDRRHFFPISNTQYLIVRTSNIRWAGKGKAIVGGSYRDWQNKVEAYIYYVTRKGDRWVVERSELIT